MKQVLVGGIPTAAVSAEELASIMVRDCRRSRAADDPPPPKLVFSSNGQGVSYFARDAAFRDAMCRADIIHADGMSVVHTARLFAGGALPERVATTDFFHNAARAAQAEGLSFYILGGTEEVNRRACAAVARLYPDLRLAGRRHGYFDHADEPAIIDDILGAGTDVLWVGLGRPRQEFVSCSWRDRLAGVGWVKTCGGLLDFLSGTHRRAPGWMQASGLEWAFRLGLEPRRLFARYLVTNAHALWLLAAHTRPAMPGGGPAPSTEAALPPPGG